MHIGHSVYSGVTHSANNVEQHGLAKKNFFTLHGLRIDLKQIPVETRYRAILTYYLKDLYVCIILTEIEVGTVVAALFLDKRGARLIVCYPDKLKCAVVAVKYQRLKVLGLFVLDREAQNLNVWSHFLAVQESLNCSGTSSVLGQALAVAPNIQVIVLPHASTAR
jgi:hypothetical protein